MDRIFYDYIKEDLNSAFSIGSIIGLMHFHLHYEINYVTSGSISVINNGTSVDCSYPCILIHSPCSFHKVISSGNEPYERYKFHFNEAYISKYNPRVLSDGRMFCSNLTVIPLTGDAGKAILPVLSLFPSEGSRSEEFNRYFAFLLDLTMRFLDSKLPLETGISDPGRIGYIGKVLSFISDSYNEDFTVDDIAKTFYVSKTKLNDDFKAIIGKTIKQHVIDVRISNAMRMLTNGKSVMNTAHDCGFIDESHFIRTFRERVGSSPKKFSKDRE